MIEQENHNELAAVALTREAVTSSPGLSGRMRRWAGQVLVLFGRRRMLALALFASLLGAMYWLGIASDRYVSEAHIIIQRTDLPGGQTVDFASMLTGGSSNNRTDQLLLRDYLRSMAVLKKLDTQLHLRAHYSNPHRDFISRMDGDDDSIEGFYRYFQTRVTVEFDDYDGVLVIRAQAYDARTALAISSAMIREGERFMNQMSRNLAEEQVGFLEKQVVDGSRRALEARNALLRYQDKKGLVSPAATVDNLSGIVAKLDAQRADLETRRTIALAYLVPTHPDVVQLNQQIEAVGRQLSQEQGKLAAPSGKTLNRTVEEFQRLELEAGYTQDLYKTTLAALDKGRVEATRTIQKVSVVQAPSLPEDATEPHRYYNTLVFLLVALLLAGVIHLLVAIVRDHID
jgi:capsular polysaccharide transport system permease protein